MFSDALLHKIIPHNTDLGLSKLMFRFAAPPFFYVSKKKLRGFPKLRGFQNNANGVQKYIVFMLKVESFSLVAKMFSQTKLRVSLKLRSIERR